ncbi:SPOR domain-containing protein [Thalassospira lucentensis]|uniref:SPOR domain-containing protein n=1 Tax=Thalassospira lucentensis TaxID=168935 RepID=UPI003AA9D973
MNEEHGNDLHAERSGHYGGEPDAGKSKTKGVLTVFLGAAVVIGGLGAAGYWFYNQGQPIQDDGKLPILLPDPSPIKLRPEDPGGMEVPHRNTTVYDQLSDVDPDADVVLQELPDMPRAPDVVPTAPKESDAAAADKDADGAADGVDAGEAEAAADVPAASSEIRAPEISEPETLSDAQKAIAAANARANQTPEATAPSKPAQNTTASATESAATGDFRIQMASLREKDRAAAEWKRLSSKNKDLLGNLKMFVQRTEIEGKGVYYRLQAGPLADAASAEKLCADLKQRNVGCLIVRP